jgi:hypothetical protein
MDVAKTKQRSILLTSMKCGRVFVDRFSKSCLPALEDLFIRDKTTCNTILKTLQQGTRTLQVWKYDMNIAIFKVDRCCAAMRRITRIRN